MSEQNTSSHIGNFEDGLGEELNIKKNTPKEHNIPARGSKNELSKNSLRAMGILALIASITFFVLAGVFSPFYAIGGALCFIGTVACIGLSMRKDLNDSMTISTNQTKSLSNDIKYGLSDYLKKDLDTVKKNNNVGREFNNSVKYDKNDFYSKNNVIERY